MNDSALRQIRNHLSSFGADYAQHFLASVPEAGSTILVGVAALAAMSRPRKMIRQLGEVGRPKSRTIQNFALAFREKMM
jgi:hypothetical protein